MGTEVELKVHAADHENCRRRMRDLAGRDGAFFIKDDDYWSPADDSPRIRVRRERSGEGAEAERTLVTWKNKEKRDGVEINEEHEFEVSRGELFEELLERLGLEKRIHKHKEGRCWTLDGTPPLTAELCEVSGFILSPDGGGPGVKNLGWFLELEILLPEKPTAPAETDAARRRLLETLARTGLGGEALEDRYYSELLAAPPPD